MNRNTPRQCWRRLRQDPVLVFLVSVQFGGAAGHLSGVAIHVTPAAWIFPW